MRGKLYLEYFLVEISMRNYIILTSITILSCSKKQDKVIDCTGKNVKANFYVINLSFHDTLAHVKLYLDDSLYANKIFVRSHYESNFYKSLLLCEGKHRLEVKFGRFKKDTIIIIKYIISAFVYMNYMGPRKSLVLPPDGVSIHTLVSDGQPAID